MVPDRIVFNLGFLSYDPHNICTVVLMVAHFHPELFSRFGDFSGYLTGIFLLACADLLYCLSCSLNENGAAHILDGIGSVLELSILAPATTGTIKEPTMQNITMLLIVSSIV